MLINKLIYGNYLHVPSNKYVRNFKYATKIGLLYGMGIAYSKRKQDYLVKCHHTYQLLYISIYICMFSENNRCFHST